MREEDKRIKDFADIEERFAAEGDANAMSHSDFIEAKLLKKKRDKRTMMIMRMYANNALTRR